MEETIAAIATPPGEGGVAIIRISGKACLDIVNRVVDRDVFRLKSHTVSFARILTPLGRALDEALVIPMKAPKSYTGEDTVEIQCHGGALISQQVLDCVIEAGARPAAAGEFTYRAFMNGKIDLAQAEAIQELIHAKNHYACQAANSQLSGRLSEHILGLQKRLTDVAAILEAWVDFPEEGLEFASQREILEELTQCKNALENLADTFNDGQKISQGITVSLLGRPNVGKSSLLNAFLGQNRAIVSDRPGTTRDFVDAEVRFGNMHFRILDTAGIRKSQNTVEMEGIRRSLQAANEADLIIFVADASQGWTEEDERLMEFCPQDKILVTWNKRDLTKKEFPLAVSAETGEGLRELQEKICKSIWRQGYPALEEITITQLRHREALVESGKYLHCLIDGLQTGVSAEFVAFELRQSLRALGKIIGQDITEEVLSSIFSKFCVGK